MEQMLDEDSSMSPTLSATTPPPSQRVAATTDLSSFINVQQADGSWKLDTSLAQLLGKSQKDLGDACPTECKGTMAMVWATIPCASLCSDQSIPASRTSVSWLQ